MTSSTLATIDGRRARRERGRAAVVDAMVDLVMEQRTPPSPDAVAERAGVSVSSLFRYFEGLADLQVATIHRFHDRYADVFQLDDAILGVGTFEERVAVFVDARLRLWATVAPMARLARARGGDHRLVADASRDVRLELRREAAAHFAIETQVLPRATARDALDAVVVLTAFDAWEHLIDGDGRSEAQLRRAWIASIRALLRPPSPK